MNKETRQFLFGILTIPVCLLGLILGIRDMRASTELSILIGNFFFCILELIGIIAGGYCILKNL